MLILCSEKRLLFHMSFHIFNLPSFPKNFYGCHLLQVFIVCTCKKSPKHFCSCEVIREKHKSSSPRIKSNCNISYLANVSVTWTKCVGSWWSFTSWYALASFYLLYLINPKTALALLFITCGFNFVKKFILPWEWSSQNQSSCTTSTSSGPVRH